MAGCAPPLGELDHTSLLIFSLRASVSFADAAVSLAPALFAPDLSPKWGMSDTVRSGHAPAGFLETRMGTKPAITLCHNGRHLEIRAVAIDVEWQIWIYEAGDRIYLHSVVPRDRSDGIERLLAEARREIESDEVVIPVIRLWPESKREDILAPVEEPRS